MGHRYVFIFGVRTPRMIAQLDDILAEATAVSHQRFDPHGRYDIHWHRFGKDAVLQGAEPGTNTLPNEVGVVADIVADSAELAHDVACDMQTRVAFWRYPGRYTTAGNVGMTLSPGSIDGGAVYEFSLYHTLGVDDYRPLFRREMIDI